MESVVGWKQYRFSIDELPLQNTPCKPFTARKVSVLGVILVRIFPHSD